MPTQRQGEIWPPKRQTILRNLQRGLQRKGAKAQRRYQIHRCYGSRGDRRVLVLAAAEHSSAFRTI